MSIVVKQNDDGTATVQNGEGTQEILKISNTGKLFIKDVGSLAATGTNQATSAAIVNTLTSVTASDGTKGVRLPTAEVGSVYFVYNSVATNGLPIFPATGGTINGGTANAAITAEGKTLAILAATSATNWAAIFTANT